MRTAGCWRSTRSLRILISSTKSRWLTLRPWRYPETLSSATLVSDPETWLQLLQLGSTWPSYVRRVRSLITTGLPRLSSWWPVRCEVSQIVGKCEKSIIRKMESSTSPTGKLFNVFGVSNNKAHQHSILGINTIDFFWYYSHNNRMLWLHDYK